MWGLRDSDGRAGGGRFVRDMKGCEVFREGWLEQTELWGISIINSTTYIYIAN